MSKENLIQNEEKKRSIYREVFLKINDAFLKRFELQKNHLSCKKCVDFSENCKHFPDNPTKKLPENCIYRFWQEKCLNMLETEISTSILKEVQAINSLKENYHCIRCATCCKLASSEFSYSELKERAKNGDIFAQQFTSVFVPYDNKEDARKFYPEFFDTLEKKYGSTNGIYFYHCPKLTPENLCSDYENRPDICRDFPTNPLVIFPPKCGYRKWQDEVDIQALTVHAMIEITEFYKAKIKEAFLSA